MLSPNALQFIESIRRNAANDQLFLEPTQKQLQKLNIQLRCDMGSELYPHRLAMIIYIFWGDRAMHLISTKLLTRHMVSVLIEETLDGKSKEIIQEIAKFIAARHAEIEKSIEAAIVHQ